MKDLSCWEWLIQERLQKMLPFTGHEDEFEFEKNVVLML